MRNPQVRNPQVRNPQPGTGAVRDLRPYGVGTFGGSSPTVLIDAKRPPGVGSASLDADAFAKVLKDAGIS
ncbi:hypothetical protein [Streptomyces sp. NPDC059994]|uniref:hypothetical protein n=1 Tax=Streptomyces sp. NPDC059994 TaxID=3347029 RepID=UPI0036AAAF9F